jgi:hypothetical protein
MINIRDECARPDVFLPSRGILIQGLSGSDAFHPPFEDWCLELLWSLDVGVWSFPYGFSRNQYRIVVA